jgi:hypothetical protein
VPRLDLEPLLRSLHQREDVPKLLAALGHEPLWDEVPEVERQTAGEPGVVVGRAGAFAWYCVSGSNAERRARALARRLTLRGRVAGILGLDLALHRLTVAVALEGAHPLVVDLAAPDPLALACLARLADAPQGGALAYAARAADALSGESAGRRFFREFRSTLERVAAGLPGPMGSEDRHSLALLQLTRVLFLYFVQAKGWLGGRERFLAEEVDRCLSHKRRIHRDLLRPLFFGTLNRPAIQRHKTAASFGAVPFLNGGLFEPHPLERRFRGDIPNEIWRDAFDRLFERFHFTVSERPADGNVAPDMLGRVFEGVMAPDQRRASGTYYTPAALVRRLLDAGLVALVAARLRCGEGEAERRIENGEREALRLLDGITLLDPAAGSGAFLVGALGRLASLRGESGKALALRKRRILRRNLFGVDLSAAAIRLSQLRLWLAVIVDDPTERPEAVMPLPNLECLVRQGDSLFEPVGTGERLPAPSTEAAAVLAHLRRHLVTATGPEKTRLLRELKRAELRASGESLAAAQARVGREVDECLEAARARDLFGRQRGLDPQLRERLCSLREEARALRHARRTLDQENEVPWFHYQSHFAQVFLHGGFDLVLGNPPWLRGEEIPQSLQRRLAGRYRWWKPSGHAYARRPDLAVAFLERGIELTAPHGIVAMLVPAKIATAGYGAVVRHGLATSTSLMVVADLTGLTDVAFDATVYPLALVTRRSAPRPSHRVHTTLQVGDRSRVPQSRLRGGGPWIMGKDRLWRTIESVVSQHPRLAEQFTCHLGVKTGANGVFLSPPATLEPELLRWAVRGRDLRPFGVEPRARLLWPCDDNGNSLKALPASTAAYLKSHELVLRARSDYQAGAGPFWGLFRTRPASARHRVIWADLDQRLTAVALTAHGDDRLVPLNSCYVAVAQTKAEAERLSAWLNCTWVRAIARQGAMPAAGGFARFNAATVGGLPLPSTVLADPAFTALTRAGRRGEPVQADLDEITARHLGLSTSACSELREADVLGACDRR